MPNKRKWILFSVYIIGVGVFFIYTLFPSDAFIDYTLYQLNRIDPNVTATIGRITPVFPPGLRFQSVNIQYRGTDLASQAQIQIHPKILSLVGSTASVDFKSDIFNGSIEGKMVIADNKENAHTVFNGKVLGVQLADIPVLKSTVKRNISGTVDGDFNGKLNKGSFENVSADMRVSDVKVENFEPIFGLAFFSFQDIDIRLALSKNSFQLKKCRLKGTQADGRVSGSITLKDPIEKSVLNLKGSLLPHPEFLAEIQKVVPIKLLRKNKSGEGKFPVRLRGTVKNPKFSLK
jgi:type II secretion system protein N